MGEWNVAAVISPMPHTKGGERHSASVGNGSSTTVPLPSSVEVPRYLAVAPLRSLTAPLSHGIDAVPSGLPHHCGLSPASLLRHDWWIVGSSDATVHCYRLHEGEAKRRGPAMPMGRWGREDTAGGVSSHRLSAMDEQPPCTVHCEGQWTLAPTSRRPVWCVAALDAVVVETPIPHDAVHPARAEEEEEEEGGGRERIAPPCCTPRFIAGDGGGRVFLVAVSLSMACAARPPPPKAKEGEEESRRPDSTSPSVAMHVLGAVQLEPCAVNALTTHVGSRSASWATVPTGNVPSCDPHPPTSPPPHTKADAVRGRTGRVERQLIAAITDSGTVHLLAVEEHAGRSTPWREETRPSLPCPTAMRREGEGEGGTLLIPVLRVAIGVTAGRGISWGNLYGRPPFQCSPLQRNGRSPDEHGKEEEEMEEMEDILAVCEERVVRLRICRHPLSVEGHPSPSHGDRAGCSGARHAAFLPPGSFLRIVGEHRCNIRGVSGMVVTPCIPPHRRKRSDAPLLEDGEGRSGGAPTQRERMHYRVVIVGQGMEVFQC